MPEVSAAAGEEELDLLYHGIPARFLAQGGRRGHGGSFGSARFGGGDLYRRRRAAAVARVRFWKNRERGGALDLDLGFRCVWHHVGEVLNLAKSSLGSRHGYIGGNLATVAGAHAMTELYREGDHTFVENPLDHFSFYSFSDFCFCLMLFSPTKLIPKIKPVCPKFLFGEKHHW